MLLALAASCARSSERAPTRAELPEGDARLEVTDELVTPAVARGLSKRDLAEAVGLELITGYDPYYRREKHFWAVSLRKTVERLLPGVELASVELMLFARDGYAVPLDGARLIDGSAYLAVADAERLAAGTPGWEPIGPTRAEPAPFYLVWKGGDRVDLERYPRPWALERIVRARFETLYPHTVPTESTEGSLARRGYALYRDNCVRCHAINREGGRVGPDLNVPRSIVEYRPRDQIRAYIRDPLSFRYGAMPAHPHLTEADLDALVEYFVVMSAHKHDPEGAR